MKDPLYFVPVKYKLTLTFVLISVVSLGIGGLVSYQTTRDALKDQVLKDLFLTGQVQVQHVTSFIDALKKRTEDFSSDGFIRDAAFRLQTSSHPALQRELSRHLRVNKMGIVPEFFETSVAGRDGLILASSDPARVGLDASKNPWFVGGRSTIFMGEIRTGEHAGEGRPSLEISAPLTDKETHEFVGVIVNRIKPEVLSEVVQAGIPLPGEGRDIHQVNRTLDSYILDREGRFITSTRRLKYKDAFLQKSHMSTRAFIDGHGIMASYRGREVVYVSVRLPAQGWTLVTELETDEAFRPVLLLRQRLFFVGCALVFITMVLLFFPLNFMIGPILRLRSAAKMIEEGKFDVSVHVDSRDEIGELSRAFNRMSFGLFERAKKLEEYTGELKKREREVRYEKDLLNAVIQCMSDGVIFIDLNGNISLFNSAAEGAWIISRDGAEGLQARFAAEVDGCFRKQMEGMAAGNKKGCRKVLHARGRIYENTCTYVHNPSGKALGIVMVSRDITERKQMEDRLLHQEKMMVVGELSAAIAHELNNPLAAMSMFAQMLIDECTGETPYREHAEVIMRNTQVCKKIIRGLLDYAARSPVKRQPFNINRCLKEAVDLYRPLLGKKDHEVVFSLDEGIREFMGDEEQIRQVFVNMIMNAMQAMESRGVLTLKTSCNGASGIEVEIQDSGPGIPSENIDKIFDPFFSTKPSGIGTGLGLSISKKVIESHGGTIRVKSETGNGTRFIITLPAVEKAETVGA